MAVGGGKEDVPTAHSSIKDFEQIVGMRIVSANQDAGIHKMRRNFNFKRARDTRRYRTDTRRGATANHTTTRVTSSLTPHHPSLTLDTPDLTSPPGPKRAILLSPHPLARNPYSRYFFSTAAMALSVFRLCRVTAAIVLGAAPLATGFVAPGLGGLRSRAAPPTKVNDDTAFSFSLWGGDLRSFAARRGGASLQPKLKISLLCVLCVRFIIYFKFFDHVLFIMCVPFTFPFSVST